MEYRHRSLARGAKTALSTLVVLLAVGAAASAPTGRGGREASILLLNSYHQGLEWTDDITTAVADVLGGHELHVEYMDTKRHADDRYLAELADLLAVKYRFARPDVVICSDDHALAFLFTCRQRLFPGVPVVFCGVNNYTPALLDGQDRVTGVVEAFDIAATLEVALDLHPATERVVVINDATKTGRANREVIERLKPAFEPAIAFEFLESLPMEDLQARVHSLPPRTIVLLMSYTQDGNGRHYDYRTAIRLIADRCPVPMYGIWDFYLGRGIVGGLLTSGRDQGRTAAGIAARIIGGEDAGDIDVVTTSPNRWKFDHRQTQRFGIDSGRLPRGSEVINRPFSLFDEYRGIIFASLATMGALAVLSLFLLETIRKLRRVQRDLVQSRQLLLGITGNVPGVVYQFYAAPDGHYGLNYVAERAHEIFGIDTALATFFDLFLSRIHDEDRGGFLTSIAEAVRTVGPWHFEGRFIRPTGETLWFSGNATPHREGDLVVFDGVLMDISEQKKTRDEIRKRQRFLESVLYHAPDAIITLDEHHRVVDWNPAAANIFGYSPEEAVGRELDALVAGDQAREEAGRKTRRVLSGKRVEAFETVRYRSGNVPVDVIAAGSPILIDGVLTGVVAMYTDITALKEAERKIRRNERMLRRIIDTVPSMIFVKNAQGRFLIANQAVADNYGMSVADLEGSLHTEVHPDPSQVERMLADDKRAIESGRPLIIPEEPFVDSTGTRLWLEVIKVPCGPEVFGETAVVGLASDITERRAAEIRLQESERRYRVMFENTGTGTVLSEADTTLSMVNSEFAALVGYTREEIEGKMSWTRFIAPQDIVRMKAYHELRRKDPALAPNQWECDLVDRSGATRRMRLKVRLIPGTKTSIGSFLDITEDRRNEEELRRLRNYLANIIDSMPSALVGVDPAGRVTQWNRQAERLTGCTFDEVASQPLHTVFPRMLDIMDRVHTAIRDRRVLREPKIPRHERGETRFEDLTIFPLVANGVEGAVIRVDDVTERVRLEEMMVQSEKMLSVGGLAAGMAHEINNPLAGILQNTAVLAKRLLDDLPANRKAASRVGLDLAVLHRYLEERRLPGMLDNIRTSGNRAAAIVQNMLSFARKSDRVVSRHDMGTLLDQTVALARTDYDMKKHYDFKQIRIVKEYDPSVGPIACEGSMLQQVFLNILKNGAEAMADTGDAAAEQRFVLRVAAEGEWARIEIEDNGPGIPESTRRRIFEPFFTTKSAGRGTGLGLSVSYFIITENHGGEMEVHPVAGGGTRFVIRLPRQGRTDQQE
jgi:PAS domain S-box-containing protein